MAGETLLVLAGDVMTGRGIDRILRNPGSPRLHEEYVRDARSYVELAERVNGLTDRTAAPPLCKGTGTIGPCRCRPRLLAWDCGGILEVTIVSATDVSIIEESAQKTRRWLDELAEELGRPGDQRYALRVLRGFLHTLRDRLPVPETAALGAQLPEFLRGVFYEGWRPSATPNRYHDLDHFLDRVATDAKLAGETEAAYAVEAAARVLRRHVGEGELGKVSAVLPRPLATMLNGTTGGGLDDHA